MRSKVKMSPAQ